MRAHPGTTSEDEETDAVLLAASGPLAPTLFARLVRRHGGVLYAVAVARVRSAPDAEELVQDAFLLLWANRSRVRLVGDSALPWLIVSVKHLAANRGRALQRRARHEATGMDAVAAAPRADESLETTDAVRRAFATLAPLDAEVARLCLVEDLTYAEAAARAGLTEGAVRNRLSRTRRRLRDELGGDR